MAKEKVAVQVPEGQAPPVSSRRADLENWLAALLPGFRAVARQAVFFLVGLLCARGVVSVSYTHLDVYKRQPLSCVRGLI